ncbi:hypothetical protein ACF3MZ_16820 [Paenibacillaceae bacterium WGS1546]|uniref:family 4 glycosyl hydrolase n=1 Tax=Cohnella sp. WGS1546 TaxID=3366810 RepID=UPI00372D7875
MTQHEINDYRRRGGPHAAPFQVEFTTDIVEAVRDADFIYTAVRVGGEEGRAIDERVALRHGVLTVSIRCLCFTNGPSTSPIS